MDPNITVVNCKSDLLNFANEMKMSAAQKKLDSSFEPSSSEEEAIENSLKCKAKVLEDFEKEHPQIRVLIMIGIPMVISLTVEKHPEGDYYIWHLSTSKIAAPVPGKMQPPEKVPESLGNEIRDAFFPDGVDDEYFAPSGFTNIKHYEKKY